MIGHPINRFILFAVVLWAVHLSSAWAGYRGFHDSGDITTAYDSASPLAACNAAAGRLRQKYPSLTIAGVVADGSGSNGGCKATINGGALSAIGWWYWDGLPDAPVTPTCTAGKVSTLTFKEAGLLKAAGDAGPASALPSSTGSCQATVSKFIRCYSDAAAAYPKPFYCTYEMTETGVASPAGTPGAVSDAPSASASTTPVTPTPKSVGQGASCPTGTVNMGVDSAGGAICGGNGTSPTVPVKTTTAAPATTTTAADGSTTQTTSLGVKNSDGSTTTTTTITVTDAVGGKTITTDQKTSAAASGGVGTPDKQGDDFCSKNPQMNACRNSSVSGACDSITVDGDAIQGAILQSVAKANCKQAADNEATKAGSQYQLGTQILAGNDPTKAAADAAIKGTDVDLSQERLDQSGFVAGSCLPDRSFQVMGKTVAVGFGPVCNNIMPLRFAILACSLIAAYLLVSKSVLQG